MHLAHAEPVTLEQATKQVISSNGKRLLSAKTEQVGNREVHVIKLLTPDGRIQQQMIDAVSGAVLDINGANNGAPAE